MENLKEHLFKAVISGDEKLVKGIVKAVNINKQDDCRETFLYYAVYGGFAEIVKILIDAGADVNAVSKWYSVPLHLASYQGNTEIARMLIEAGADISMTNIYNQTPLMIAINEGHTEIVELLKQHGARV